MKKSIIFFTFCLFLFGTSNTGYSQKAEVCEKIGAVAGAMAGAAVCAEAGPVVQAGCAAVGSEIGRSYGKAVCEKPSRPSREKPSRDYDAGKAYRDAKAKQDRDYHDRGGAWDRH